MYRTPCTVYLYSKTVNILCHVCTVPLSTNGSNDSSSRWPALYGYSSYTVASPAWLVIITVASPVWLVIITVASPVWLVIITVASPVWLVIIHGGQPCG